MKVSTWCRGKVIGRGSTATVFAAVDDKGSFAVKSAELARSYVLQREQKLISAMNSPSIIRYLGFDISTGSVPVYNLFLEYAARGSLLEAIKFSGGGVEESVVRSYTFDIVKGLNYLHSSSVGVVHCDIKPDNILICDDGHAKIADFGCAHYTSDNYMITEFKGTPMFMAPEVVRGEEQGEAADIWALGCTIINMVSGESPWTQSSDYMSVIYRIGFSDELPEFSKSLSDEGKDFLSKCLVRDPRKRWTAEQLLHHPFVSNSKFETFELNADYNLVSPKSILDQQMFLQSLSDSCDEDGVEDELFDKFQRIHELSSSCNGPNWTWDENWITVRSVGSDCSSAATFIAVVEADEVETEAVTVNRVTVDTIDHSNATLMSVIEMYSDQYSSNNSNNNDIIVVEKELQSKFFELNKYCKCSCNCYFNYKSIIDLRKIFRICSCLFVYIN